MTIQKHMIKALEIEEDKTEALYNKLCSLKQVTNNPLKKYVIESIIDHCLSDMDSDENIKNYIEDVSSHGCASGMVCDLIYYSQTTQFYQRFKDEIFNLEIGRAHV